MFAMAPLEHSRPTRLLIAIAIIVVVAFIAMGGAKLMCRGSLRSCDYFGESCPNDTVCVDYGDGWKRCSPSYCPWVRDCCEVPVEVVQFRDKWWGKVVVSVRNVVQKVMP
jgi:hypothetical protein